MRNITQTTDMLIQWCDKRGVPAGIDEFISYLSDISSEYLLPLVLEELESRSTESSFYEQLHVASAAKLDDGEVTALRTGFGVTSSKTKQRTDTDLLAGVSCEYNGIQIKDNLHGRLRALQNRLYIN
jgi:F0F1-type ATP synthase delta subunit